MVTSNELQAIINFINDAGTDMELVIAFLRDTYREDPTCFRFLDPQQVKEGQRIRNEFARCVWARQEPTRELREHLIQLLVQHLGDDAINDCFTRIKLTLIPGVVKRWKRVRALNLVELPGPKVTAYLRQATTSYLRGLPTAAALLCRTSLQFALEEKLANLGGINLDNINRRDWLAKLVNLARST